MARKKLTKSVEAPTQDPIVRSTEPKVDNAREAFRRAVEKLKLIPDYRREPTKENALWFMRQGYVIVQVGGEDGSVALQAAKKLADE